MKYLLGHSNGNPFYLPRSSFDTHWHLIGGTGKGKTTAIHTMLHELMLDPFYEPCIFIIDRMGGLSSDLLLWMSSEFCTDEIRDRLIYIEPSRDTIVMGFNPFLHESLGEAYYKVSRATEIILKGWASQNIGEMPRLARWLFNCFYACALMGLAIADTVHLLTPDSPFHKALLNLVPAQLKAEWTALLNTSDTEVSRQLESTRNRLHPFFNAPALTQMFGATTNRLDVRQFVQDRRIVLLNLQPGERISDQLSDAIGGMVINEILSTARSTHPLKRKPTYLFLDEFQRFIGPDLEAAIPEVRQLGIKLLLSHQSLSQLNRGDYDLRTLIFVAQSRMVFGLQGEDADLLANEFASLTYDPKRVKEELYTLRQRIAGYRKLLLHGTSTAQADGESWMKTHSASSARFDSVARDYRYHDTKSQGLTMGDGTGESDGGSRNSTFTQNTHEAMQPIHEDFRELSSRTFFTYDEQMREWASKIRQLTRGNAIVHLVDTPGLHDVFVKKSTPGHLDFPPEILYEEFPEAIEDQERLLEKNFSQGIFVSPEVIEQETRQRIERVLQQKIVIPDQTSADPEDSPFS